MESSLSFVVFGNLVRESASDLVRSSEVWDLRPNGAFSKSSKYDIEILECTDIYSTTLDDLT